VGKSANIRIFWKKSVSADVQKVNAKITVAGTTQELEFGPEVQEAMVKVAASSSVHVEWVCTDSEGLQSVATMLDFSIGDLVNPQPVTDPGFEIVSIVDDGDGTPPVDTPPGGNGGGTPPVTPGLPPGGAGMPNPFAKKRQ
jgi:hypothetical protein